VTAIRGLQGEQGGENRIGGNAGPAVGIWLEGCPDAELRGNVVRAFAPGEGAPGGNGGRGGRGGGIRAYVVKDSPRALLSLNEAYDLPAGASGASGASGPPTAPPGHVLGLHVIDSEEVELEGFVVHDLLLGDRVAGLELSGSTLTATRVLAYRLHGARMTEGMLAADGSRLVLSRSTLANLGEDDGRGSVLAARRGGHFEATWSIFHRVPGFFAEGDASGQVATSVISSLVAGSQEADNVTVAGDVVRGDPMFINEATGDFRLSPESPAVDVGPGGEICADEPGGLEECVLDWGYYGGTPSGSQSIF